MLSILCRNQSLIRNRWIHTSSSLKGYIVLVPEIGEDAHLTDALLRPDGLPQFNGLTIENCLAAIGQQAAAVEKSVKNIEEEIKSKESVNVFEDIFNVFELATAPLETTWGMAKTLYLGNSTLMPTKSYLNIHERARRARASKFNNQVIFDTIKNSYDDVGPEDAEKKRLMEKYLLEGKLNGMCLSSDQKINLRDIISDLSKERANYRNKLSTAINQFAHVISNYGLVRDFPPNLLEAMAVDPNQPTKGPWKVSLQPQIVQNFLKFCPDRLERWNVWQANVRKASGQSEKSLENSTHLEKIRGLRKRQAELLGYPTYTAMSMQTKMIKTVEKSREMFGQLLKSAGPAQFVEIQTLQQFASQSGFDQKLEEYDVPYWQRKQMKSEFDMDEEILKEYFPLPRVIPGLIATVEKLFDIKVVEKPEVEVWHSSVKYYDIFDNNDTSKPIAGFYLDSYSKEHQFRENSGWMVGIRNRNVVANNNPLSALIFNFQAPMYGKPYLLSIEELRMVFKTFGAAMQHLLTKANYSDLAGLSNIEWDASQICGQVMVNFLDDANTIKAISGHYSTDEQIPQNLLDNMKQLKTNLAAYNLCKELYYSDLDLELHHSNDFWLDVVRRLWPVYRCMPLDKKDAHPCSMPEIFSGDWAAAYFSHLYSKVIAADVYDAFVDNSNLEDKSTPPGKRFKETFLAYGGSVCTAEVFRRFRGRDPSPEALLKSLDLLNESQTSEY